jgi:amino acid adenylation domain-containing protein
VSNAHACHDDGELATLAQTVPELIRDRARTAPAAVAAVTGDEEMTYAELDTRATALAARLAADGAGRGTLVGVALDRTLHSLVAPLAIWYAGATYVPLDPRFPVARLAGMVAAARVDRLLVDKTNATLTRELGLPGTDVDATSTGEAGELPPPGPTAEDIAYVIFTSGSSGPPKGVAVRHAALVRHVVAIRERFGVESGDRVLAFSSFSFDASLDQLLPALTMAAAVVLRSDERWSPAQLLDAVERHRVSVLNLPPTYWAELTAELSERPEPRLASVRLLVLGGEPLPPGPLARWRAAVPRARVLNAYGPTETTITATTFEVPPGAPGERIPIGRPVGARLLYIVDAHGEPVPAGQPGELLVGGPEIADGYLRRPELTAEWFLPDRFAGQGRVYRTGDLVRLLPSGDLEFLGRVDDQIKIRGHRVEPAEIEALLSTHPDVASCAVVAAGQRDLVAYLVCAGTAPPDVEHLRSFLGAQLPDYLLPSIFAELPALPTTPTGKVDRAALERMEPEALGQGSGEQPRDELEETVAELWRVLLRRDGVGIHDSFFDLGGHSMLAARLVSQVRKATGVRIVLNDIFRSPTVAELCDEIRERRSAG